MIEITVPPLGGTVEKAKILRWEFASGDHVKADDILLVIEADKATLEMPAPADGIIYPVASAGSTCRRGEILGYLAETREEYMRLRRETPPGAPEAPGSAAPPAGGERFEHQAEVTAHHASSGKGRILSSPVARAVAAAHDLDLTAVAGSGPGGRILKADVLQAIEERGAARREEPEAPPVTVGPQAVKEVAEHLPIAGARRVIFDNMFQSLSESAQLTLHTEASAEAVVALRTRLRERGAKVSYNAILMKVTAHALREHPGINASVDGESICLWRQVNIGLAIDAGDALVVPVIASPDTKTIRKIDDEITALTDRALENRLTPDDLAGGTFTITNLGFAGVDYFTPILRPPESAILGVGRILTKPCIKNNQVVPEARMGLSLTFDHRIIDGAPAGRFLKTVKDMIEDPLLIIG